MQNTNNIHIDAALVHQLITAQFPQWANLPIRQVAVDGWDNRTFHLGEHMTVRLPSAAEYAHQVEKEHRWLPKLAPLLPLPIPTPLVMGKPTPEYPWHWSIYKWLDGQTASMEPIADLNQFATKLAQFLIALQQAPTFGGPVAGPHNFYRGGPLTTYDTNTRQKITALRDKIDASAALAVWDAALASTWQQAPVWVHGDIAVGNLLVEKGQLSAVIDFGCCGIGDPACDLAITWTLFKEESRRVFRSTLSLDNETWTRARGWALWKAVVVIAQPNTNPYVKKYPLEIEKSWRVINEILADHKLKPLK